MLSLQQLTNVYRQNDLHKSSHSHLTAAVRPSTPKDVHIGIALKLTLKSFFSQGLQQVWSYAAH